MRSRTAAFLAIAIMTCMSLLPARPVQAKANMLKRSAENISQAPLDYLFIPFTSVSSLVRNYYMSERHSWIEKTVFTPVIAAVYVPCCVFMSSALPTHRIIEGAVTLPVGVALAGTDADFHLYQPAKSKRSAVVNRKTDNFHVYFGAYYCEGFFK